MQTATASTPARRLPQPALQQQQQQPHSNAPTRAWARAWRQQRQHLLAPTLLLLCAATLPSLQAHAQTLSTGARHGLALQADGSVLAWGDNRQAQLGQGRTVFAATAREIALPAKATMVRTNRTSALVLDADGNVWSWGTNLRGELGDGTHTDRSAPQIIFRGATFVANGGEWGPSFVIDKDGQPWWWGPLPNGVNTPVDATVPQRATTTRVPARLVQVQQQGLTTVALDDQGVVWSWGEGVACAASPGYSQPVAMRDVPPVVDLLVSASAPVADRWNYLPNQRPVSRITAKTADGALWTWGTDPVYPSQTTLPPPPKTDCPPVRSPSGSVDLFDRFRSTVHPDMLRAGVQIKTIQVAGDGYLGLTAEGDLWQWRSVNPYETPGWQIALQKVASNVVDVSSSRTEQRGLASVVMYITRDGKLYALGSNTGGHLATPAGELESSASPRKVALPGPAVSVHASGTGSHALLQDGRIFAWGNGATQYDPSASFTPGIPPQVPTQVVLATPVPVQKLATALGQWLAVDANGKVWSSGGWGIWPITHTRPVIVGEASGMPLARDVAVGGNGHGLILGVDGSVWRIGSNGGTGYLPPGTDPFSPAAIARRYTPVKIIGLPSTIVQVATVDDVRGASYALDAAGQVWFWGDRTNSGIAGVDGRALPSAEWLVMDPIVLPMPGKAVSIHGGEFNACAVLQDGTAQCYGKLFNNHLGRRLRMHAPIVAVSMGMDEDKQLSSIFAQRGGSVHLRLADGTVWALGQGRYGQLGTGAYASVAEPVPVAGEAGRGELDLAPATPNVPTTAGNGTGQRPPFRVNMALAGNPRSLAFNGEIFGSAGTPAGANVYALATQGVPGAGSTWLQLDAQGHWGPLRWPVPALASNAQLTSEAQALPLTLLPRLDGPGLEGLRLFIGYGSDVDEMLRAGRFREVLELGPDLGALTPSY